MGRKRKQFNVGLNYCEQMYKALCGAFERDMKIAQRYTTSANEVQCLKKNQAEFERLKAQILPMIKDESQFDREACDKVLARMKQIVQRTFRENTFTGYQQK